MSKTSRRTFPSAVGVWWLALSTLLLACRAPTHQMSSYAHITCPIGSFHPPGAQYVTLPSTHPVTIVWHPSLDARATASPASVSLWAVLIGPFPSLATFHLAMQPDGSGQYQPRNPVAASAPVIKTDTWTGKIFASHLRLSHPLAPGSCQRVETIQVRGMAGTTTGEGRCIIKIVPSPTDNLFPQQEKGPQR